MDGLSNGLDADHHPESTCFLEAFENLVYTHKSDLQSYDELVTSVEKSPNLKIRNPIDGSCHKIKNYYVNAQKRNTKAFEELNSAYNSLLAQEAKLQFEIDQVQKNSERIKQKFSKYKAEHKLMKGDFKVGKFALNLAKETYDAKFGMDMEIESESDDVFVAVVYFKPSDKSLPVKFTIDRQQNKIIDFDATSILTKDEEKEMKTKLDESGNILALTSALRNKVHSKKNLNM